MVGGGKNGEREDGKDERRLAHEGVRRTQAELIDNACFHQPHGNCPFGGQDEQRQGKGNQHGGEEGRAEQVAFPFGARVVFGGGEEDGAAARGGNQRCAE